MVFKAYQSSKISPIFHRDLTRSDFLGQEHWLRYKIFKKLLYKGKFDRLYSSRVIDERYEYWFQAFWGRSFIVGTDDSGKLFTMFHAMNTSATFRYREQLWIRFNFFNFHYHWWETDKINESLSRSREVLVRLQGDLTVRVSPYRDEDIFELLWYNNVQRYVMKHTSPFVEIAFTQSLPNTFYYDIEKNIPFIRGSFISWLEQEENDYNPIKIEVYNALQKVIAKDNHYRIVWGLGRHKHVVEFDGFRLGQNNFLIKPGVVKTTHKEHGTNEMKFLKPVIFTF